MNNKFELDIKQNLIKKINENFSEIIIKKPKLISEWYDNDVLDVNGEYIFRFTKKWVNFKTEVVFLNELSWMVKLDIPTPIYVAPDYSFTWYHRIWWYQFSNDIIANLTTENRQKIAYQIAEFLVTLHRFNDNCKIKMNPPIYHRAKNNWKRIPELIKDEVDLKVLEFYSNLSNEWQNYNGIEENIWLLHNDLYSRNIFINSNFDSITGIIDFSDMTVGDINLEFMSMYFENKEFTTVIINHYQTISSIKLDIPRIELFAKTFALTEYFFTDPLNSEIAKRWIFGKN